MVFEREKETLAADEVLRAIANCDEIKLVRCRITGELDFGRLFCKDENIDISKLNVHQEGKRSIITIAEPMVFNECVFEDIVFMAGDWAEPESIGVVFKRDIKFNLSLFKGQSRFDGAVFRGLAGFDGCRFQSVASFRNINFHSSASFRTAGFEGYSLFSDSVFSKDARFANAYFGKGGNFSKVRFAGSTNFAGAWPGSRSVPIYESVSFDRGRFGTDETFWRFVKQAAQEAGHYQTAGESFYAERCARLYERFLGRDFDALSPLKRTARMMAGVRLIPELIFGRWLFGYGERPGRVLMSGVLVMLLCAAVYYFNGTFLLFKGEQTTMGAWDSLYFSAITFATLGLGDLYPQPHSLVRFVVMAESLCGIFLTALFVVCLAKRYSRG